MARGTHKDAMRHARPRGRAARAHVARRWRVHVAGPHESTQMPRWCHVARGLASEGPTG